MGIFETLSRRRHGDLPTKDEFREQRIYDYSSPEGRVNTAEWLLAQAKGERTGQEALWRRYEEYYNGSHEVAAELQEQLQQQGLDWIPPAIPDPYIMVESQIIPDVPQPEFRGRDGEKDGENARTCTYRAVYGQIGNIKNLVRNIKSDSKQTPYQALRHRAGNSI